MALPYLTSALGHEKPEKDLLKSFPPLLQELDNGLRDRQYLVGVCVVSFLIYKLKILKYAMCFI